MKFWPIVWLLNQALYLHCICWADWLNLTGSFVWVILTPAVYWQSFKFWNRWFDGFRFSNVRICCFSWSYIMLNETSLGFGQNTTSEDVTLHFEVAWKSAGRSAGSLGGQTLNNWCLVELFQRPTRLIIYFHIIVSFFSQPTMNDVNTLKRRDKPQGLYFCHFIITLSPCLKQHIFPPTKKCTELC